MQFGVAMFPADFAINVVDLGRAVEERGFESLFVPEHTHIPAARETDWPQGGELPREYAHTLDPFVALAAVSSVTSRILLGTGICLVIQRDPIVLAKEVASLDLLSGGRFLFGVGAGWNREEIANHGVDPRVRWRVFGERMRAMQAIWTQDEANFSGRYVNFERIWSWPKPVQKPYPPVLMGGDFGAAIERVIEFGDEWMPHPDRGGPLAERISEFWARCESAGRDHLPVTVYGAPSDPKVIDEYASAGVTRCVFRIPSASSDIVLPALDRAAEVMRLVAA
ncbi:MAG: LLM class F420-dependent oxidoreductase [Chloroflexi bacterium]|nr:LLM class F420-dependent oxidoreductase [Chloroflexota bacterium]MBV9897992.1 LLM class F420-dependent oxidoreductase [Chloroflexota bacterium]